MAFGRDAFHTDQAYCGPHPSTGQPLSRRGNCRSLPPLTLTRAPIQVCPSLSYVRTGINVTIDDVLEYLAKPTQQEDGEWEWSCPYLKEVDIKQWRGRERSLYHVAWARWEVPSDRVEGPVPRTQLERLIQPLKISRDLANLLKRCARHS